MEPQQLANLCRLIRGNETLLLSGLLVLLLLNGGGLDSDGLLHLGNQKVHMTVHYLSSTKLRPCSQGHQSSRN